MLCQMPYHRRTAQEPGDISDRQNQIEMIGAIALFNELEFPFEVFGLALHQRNLVLGQPAQFAALIS